MSRQSTPSAWKDPLREFKGPPLTTDRVCDVCIVGAGIAGLTAAYLLARSGRQVTVIDSNESPGGGETRYTTAHLASAIDDRYFEVARIRGDDIAKIAHQSHAGAIDQIETICKAERIDCGFRRLDGYLFAAPNDQDVIHKEHEAARNAGCVVELLGTPPLPNLGDGPCLRFRNQGTFEPSRYLAGLWAAAARYGTTFFGRTRVREIHGGMPAEIKTDREHTIRANVIFVATNTPIHTRVAMHTKVAPYTTYAIAGTIPHGTVPDALFWDTLDPYHYIRVVTPEDRDEPNAATDLLLVGGADHRTGQDPNPGRRWDDLEVWTRNRFPEFVGPHFLWSGMVMETLDGLAYIGADPTGERNVYLATGDSGMGLTHGTIAGIIINDLIHGRSNPWAEAYDPRRLPFRATGEYATEGLNMALPYADWLTSGDVKSEAEIAPGHGAIVRHRLTKLAIYRDDDGALHTMSAVCPHLGGLVRWNPAEKTWDCPCHGSRFLATGEVIHGPAHCGLSPRKPDIDEGSTSTLLVNSPP
jgi:glycine/D-amino acid oxidase-like deaminating enzyme/nitrite reductase/ring-hydroxylating ferredoxin subunit